MESEIRRFLDRFGWKKITSGEYVLEVKHAFSARAFFKQNEKASIETTIRLAQELNNQNVRQILTDTGEEYVEMFEAKIDHYKKQSKCIITLSFGGGFTYPFEKLNTYFLAGLYEFIQKNKKLGISLLGEYTKSYEAMLSGNYYDNFSTIVRVRPDIKVHMLSRNQENSITLHDKLGYYDAQSSLFGETKDNVFLPLLSYFLENRLIMLIPKYGKAVKRGISLFTGIKVLHVSKLQRHFRELIRMVKKEVESKRIEPHILKWHGYVVEGLATDQVNFIRYYWAFHDFIHDLPNASKDDLSNDIKNKISRITPLLDDVDACISYSNCLVDYYLKRKACYEETRFQELK